MADTMPGLAIKCSVPQEAYATVALNSARPNLHLLMLEVIPLLLVECRYQKSGKLCDAQLNI